MGYELLSVNSRVWFALVVAVLWTVLGCIVSMYNQINSSPSGAAYMHQWTGSALVEIMASCLFGAKPLPEPMLAYCQLDSWEQISVKFESKFYHFFSRKCIWNYRLLKWRPFCPGGDELTYIGLIWTRCGSSALETEVVSFVLTQL